MGCFQIIQKVSEVLAYAPLSGTTKLQPRMLSTYTANPLPLSEAQAIPVATTSTVSQIALEKSSFPFTSADIFKQHNLAIHKLY